MRPKREKLSLIQGVRSDINVTPLVDVCLVLLIIFMVVTPMLQNGVDVALPETPTPEKIPENQKQLTVAIKYDAQNLESGSVFIGQNWVPDADLKGALETVYNETPDKEVIIKADRRLKYKKVRQVMQMINEAGFSRVGVVTKKDTAGA
jgi:biopolymer transport protein TolR